MNIFIIFLFKYSWIMFIVITFANALIMKRRSKVQIEKNPSLNEGYVKLFKGIIIWGNIPWIVMGIGILTGSVPTIFHYFRPRDGNPYVIAFFISVFLLWILGSYWLFFKNGAEILVKHPGIFNYNISSPTVVKFLWILLLFGGIIAVTMMFTMNIPVLNFR